jgi:hypothetical protein
MITTPIVAAVEADSALTQACQAAADAVKSNITAIVPIALGILGVVIGIRLGIKVFKKLTNSSAS